MGWVTNAESPRYRRANRSIRPNLSDWATHAKKYPDDFRGIRYGRGFVLFVAGLVRERAAFVGFASAAGRLGAVFG